MAQQIESYNGNNNIKREGVVTNFTEEQVLEYTKCMKDPSYFCRNYVKVIHLDKGLVPFNLYDYQERMFDHFNENRFSIVLSVRQSGKSISSCAYLLWYAIFHSEKTIAIIANKGSTAREMLSRITLMLENLPFFLQPGCKTLNKGSIEFDNNSRIVSAATSSSSIRGMSVNLLYLDEFAFVENDTEFYTSTYPVVTSGASSRVIITSTANGIGNMFHKLWEGTVQKTNTYAAFRVDWWDVPGRDEKWKRETIQNTSELQFKQEFGNEFLGGGNTLIDGNKLLSLQAQEPIFRQGDVAVYKKPVEGHEYMMTVDVSHGRGQDYSTFNIIDVSTRPFEQVATYRNNKISPLLFPDIIYKYANAYNEAYVIVESNDQGSVVCNGLYHELEYENMHLESAVKADSIGIRMTKKVKRLGCSNIKDLIEEDKIKLYDAQTIIELSTFKAKGASYEADNGSHDDLVMNLVMFGYFVNTNFFSDLTDINIKEMIHAENMAAIEQDVVPFGVHDNGLNNNLPPNVIDETIWSGNF